MKITCLAIDDEPMALAQIAEYVRKTPFLDLVAECQGAFEAMEVMRTKTVQLLFIDINMPDLSGMEFAKSLTTKPYIVFTTAYSEFAAEGFRVDATDYLLKPISYQNFLKAANKVKNIVDLSVSSKPEPGGAAAGYIFVKSDYKLIRIDLDEISYIESMHEYVKICLTDNRQIVTLSSLKSIEEMLPPAGFMRVHRSYIVNLSKVAVIERNRIVFNGKVYIPVSDQYKAAFQQFIERNTRQV